MPATLLEISAKYCVLSREWGELYYAFLEVSMDKIALWKNVRVYDWTPELAIIASNVKWNFKLIQGEIPASTTLHYLPVVIGHR